MANLILVDAERLGEAVRDFPVIYDKQNRAQKDTNVVDNAWKEVVDTLDFVEKHFFI